MAGHPKWTNIRHKKAKGDSKRSKFFAKIIKELTVAMQKGEEHSTGNPRLSMIVAVLKHFFTKHSSNMGTNSFVSFLKDLINKRWILLRNFNL